MELTLRGATPLDAERVTCVLIESRKAFLPFAPSAHPESDVYRWVHDVLLTKSQVTVAEDAGTVIGVVATTENDGYTWINEFYIHPTHVGRGIGSWLLAHVLTVAAGPIRLYTFQQNEGARRFYERHGFVAIQFGDGAGNEERCPDVLYELAAIAHAV